MVFGGEEAGVAPGEGPEAEVEDAVEFVEGDAHVEPGFGGGEAIAAGLLHDLLARKAGEKETMSQLTKLRTDPFISGRSLPSTLP